MKCIFILLNHLFWTTSCDFRPLFNSNSINFQLWLFRCCYEQIFRKRVLVSSFLVVMKWCFAETFQSPCCKETIGLHNKLTAQPCLTLHLSRKCKTNKHFPEQKTLSKWKPNNWLARFPTKRNIVQLERKKSLLKTSITWCEST